MKYEASPGFVLHSRRYRDTSLIVQVFTREHGRLSVVAKGASRPKSPFRNILQPAKLLTIAASGKTDLLTLTLAEESTDAWQADHLKTSTSAVSNSAISSTSQRSLSTHSFFALSYLNELLLKSTANFDPHPELFWDYQAAIAAFYQEGASIAWILRRFEYQLLTKLGLMSDFSMVVDTGNVPGKDSWYAYHPEIGLSSSGLYHPSVAPLISGAAIACLLTDTTLSESAVDDHQALKRLMRRLVDQAIPGGLKSREVIRAAWQAS